MRRIQTDSLVWHVFCRGARRLNLFHEETDFLVFLTLLTDALRATGCELWAYVLMSNHFHLAARRIQASFHSSCDGWTTATPYTTTSATA